MQKLLGNRKLILIIASVALVGLIALLTVYIINSNSKPSSLQSNAVQTEVTEKEVVKKEVAPVTEETVNKKDDIQVAPAQTQAPQARSQAPQPETTTQAQEDARISASCVKTKEFIDTRYVQKKDVNGNPYYENNTKLLEDLKKNSALNYNLYRQCVDTGNLPSL